MLDGTWSHGASRRIWLQSWYLELWDHCIGASQRICAICISSTNESPFVDDSGRAAIVAKLCHWKILHRCACSHSTFYSPSTGESFSRSFKEMVRMCLQKEARKRPTVQTLMNCKFFKIKWPVGCLVNELLRHVGNISVIYRRFKQSNYFFHKYLCAADTWWIQVPTRKFLVSHDRCGSISACLKFICSFESLAVLGLQ